MSRKYTCHLRVSKVLLVFNVHTFSTALLVFNAHTFSTVLLVFNAHTFSTILLVFNALSQQPHWSVTHILSEQSYWSLTHILSQFYVALPSPTPLPPSPASPSVSLCFGCVVSCCRYNISLVFALEQASRELAPMPISASVWQVCLIVTCSQPAQPDAAVCSARPSPPNLSLLSSLLAEALGVLVTSWGGSGGGCVGGFGLGLHCCSLPLSLYLQFSLQFYCRRRV